MFRAVLFRYPGPGGWTFAKIPDRHAPPATHGFGRTPVTATVDGHTWDTSVWKDREHGTLLAIPKPVRGTKADGDHVEVALELRDVDLVSPPVAAPRAKPRAKPITAKPRATPTSSKPRATPTSSKPTTAKPTSATSTRPRRPARAPR